MVKLNLGCGKTVMEGFTGVDSRDFGQAVVCDLRDTWKWEDGSVDEVHASHFVEHLTGPERIHFVNELWRVLKPGGKAQLITPHWASNRAYGDLTHQWPPVSEMWFYYLSREWREANAPHNDFYLCDFEAKWGYSMHPALAPRNTDYQQNALQFWKEAAQDIICTLTKRTAKVATVETFITPAQTGG
jgi:SAM-dependent methyltransferase